MDRKMKTVGVEQDMGDGWDGCLEDFPRMAAFLQKNGCLSEGTLGHNPLATEGSAGGCDTSINFWKCYTEMKNIIPETNFKN